MNILIGIGTDHNAFEAKEEVKTNIEELGHEVKDYDFYSENDVDYPGITLKQLKVS